MLLAGSLRLLFVSFTLERSVLELFFESACESCAREPVN